MITRRFLLLAGGLLAMCLTLSAAVAQNNGGNNGGGNNNNNAAGVAINADGLLTAVAESDAATGLDRKRREQLAGRQPKGDWRRESECRKVSLTQLEAVWNAALAAGTPLPDDILLVAGLQRIDYCFVLPESHELVIAGPAEGCVPDQVGRMVGVESGRPALRLEDFLVIWQTLESTRSIGCSIDPDPQRLADLQRFLKQTSGGANAASVEARFRRMPEILGLQNVSVTGLPADSRAATVLVEADWRMKRISLGLEQPGVKGLKSHLAMLGTGGNSMQRWYFVPFYERLERSADGLAYEFRGQRLQLVSQEELTDAQGQRSAAPHTRHSTQAFAKQFTARYEELAKRSAVFAELQNLVDWTLVASLMRRDNLPDQVGWTMEHFNNPEKATYVRLNPPRKVASLMNAKRTGNMVVGLVGGGVVLNQGDLLQSEAWRSAGGEPLEPRREAAAGGERSAAHAWWWD